MKRLYDVIICGSGPSGLFAAIKLAGKGLQVAILDSGPDLNERIKNPMGLFGFGGSGAKNDGKLIFSKITGGRLNEIIGDVKLENYLLESKKIWLNFIGDLEIDDFTNLSSHKLVKQAKDLGLELIVSDTIHVGSDLLPNVLNNIREYLIQNNVDIIMNCNIQEIEVNKYGIKLYSPDSIFDTKYAIIAPGRGGAKWLQQQSQKIGLKQINNNCDVGVRVEVPFEIVQHLTDELYEFKLKYITPSYHDEVRTFCVAPRGRVIEEQHDNLILVNGYSNKNKNSQNTNFAFLSSIKLEEPESNPLEFSENIIKTVNSIAQGSMVQRLQDLVEYKRTKTLKWNQVIPSLKTASCGDLALAYPYRFVTNIIEGLQGIDKIAPGIFNNDTLLFSPEVKLYSSMVQVDEHMESNISNLYCIGDGSGISHGLVQSSISGLIAAYHILEQQ
jgi:hypothetical protein